MFDLKLFIAFIKKSQYFRGIKLLNQLFMKKIYLLALCLIQISAYSQLTCATGLPSILYAQDFEGGFPTDWNQIATSVPQWQYTTNQTSSTGTGPLGAQNNTGYVYLETSGGAAGLTDTMYSPLIDLSSTVDAARMVFYYHMFGATMGTLNVDITTDQVNWTNVFTQTGQVQTALGDPWVEVDIDMTPYAGNPIWVRFVGVRGTSFTGDISIDNFFVEACISCPAPTLVNISNLTQTTADLAWTNGGTETDWIIEYGPVGFIPGTGTTVNTSTNPTTVTGLIDNTNYDFYVYANCGPGDESNAAGPVTAATTVYCIAPTGFNFTYTSNDTAAYTWTPMGLESQWTIEYGPSGYTPGTGTTATATNIPDTTFSLPLGNVYDFYVQADCGLGVNNPWTGPITYATPSTNDEPCSAINVPVDGSTTLFSNFGATEAPGTPVTGFNTVWFTFTAPTTGNVEVSTCGNDFNNFLEVYSFGNCTNLPGLPFYDGSTGNPFTTCPGTFDPAGINLCGLVPGNTYYIVVGSEVSMDVGIFPLTLTEIVPLTAGVATPGGVCDDNANFDLFTLISGNSTTTGTWYNPSVAPGNVFNTPLSFVGTPEGTYPFFYVETDACGDHTVQTSVTVGTPHNVGNGGSLPLTCNYGYVNLFDGLSGTIDLDGEWHDANGNVVSSLLNFNGEPSGSYNFYYVIDDGLCPADSSAVGIALIDCASLDENSFLVDVYPNPVNDILTVQTINADAQTTVELFDIRGLQVVAPINMNNTSIKVEMGDLANGIYFLRVNSNGASQDVRIVKQ